MKEVENNKTTTKRERIIGQTSNTESSRDFSSINNSNFVPSSNIDFLIKRISNPSFIGSIHLKKEMNPNYHQIENILASEYDSKLTQSLKNTIFNPVTKILIISAIVFNIFWFLSIYLL